MHQLFVVTGCQFTLNGLDWLMKEGNLPVKVIQVRTPEDVLATPPEGGNRAVLIVMPTGAPVVRAECRLFLWRWALLRPVSLVGTTPCILLSGTHEGGVAGMYSLSRHLPLWALSSQLSLVLNHPFNYVWTCSRIRPLTAMQRVVLEATMRGEPVSVTAMHMGVEARSVFACRTALIRKLGLRNRMELMCLSRGGDLM